MKRNQMKKAFSTLEIKSTEEIGKKRTFSGIASTPTPDRDEDVVEPKGATYKLPLPFLWQHDARKPIGWINKVKITDKGIAVEGEVADIPEEGELKKEIDKAWHALKYKLVRGLSIGFKILEAAEIQGTRWGQHIMKWEWLELSGVTIAANQEASISVIKSAYKNQFKYKAASGRKTKSGVSGLKERNGIVKTLFEELQELKDDLATKTARMAEISESIKEKSASDSDKAEFDSLIDEIQELENDIRIKTAECYSAKSAKTPAQRQTPRSGDNFSGIGIKIKGGLEEEEEKEKDPEKLKRIKGMAFTRKVIAKTIAALDHESVVSIAQKRWGKDRPKFVASVKAAVEGGGTGSGEWGEELVSADTRYTGDFIDLLYEKSVFDKLPLREVPTDVTIKGRDGAATASWVGESKAIPVHAQDFSDVTLSELQIGALTVVSQQLIRRSSPSAEMLIRDALIEACVKRADETFISASAAVAGVSPAGILNGVSAGSASGTDADSLRADIGTLYSGFIAAKNANGLYFVMNPSLAKSIQLLYNALGQPEFDGITQDGGMLLGDKVITGDNVNANHLILLKPSDIWKIGDTGMTIDVSREATIEMDDSPAMDSQAPAGATGATVNMFQTNSVAIRLIRNINFQRRRTAASCVAYISDAAYDNSSS